MVRRAPGKGAVAGPPPLHTRKVGQGGPPSGTPHSRTDGTRFGGQAGKWASTRPTVDKRSGTQGHRDHRIVNNGIVCRAGARGPGSPCHLSAVPPCEGTSHCQKPERSCRFLFAGLVVDGLSCTGFNKGDLQSEGTKCLHDGSGRKPVPWNPKVASASEHGERKNNKMRRQRAARGGGEEFSLVVAFALRFLFGCTLASAQNVNQTTQVEES